MHTRFGQYIKEGIFNYRMESVGYSPKKDMRTYQKFNKYLKNNIRWSVKGEPSNTLKELLDSIEESKNWVVVCSSSFRKVLNYTHNQESFYIKQYTVKSRWESAKSLFSLSKARREWNHSHKLPRNYLHTAEPVAVGEKRRFGILKECYIISKTIPNSMPVIKLLVEFKQSPAVSVPPPPPVSGTGQALTHPTRSGENVSSPCPPPEGGELFFPLWRGRKGEERPCGSEVLPSTSYKSQKEALLKNLIFYVRTMHDLGIFHGELHASNILVDRNNITLFYLLDLGCAKYRKVLPLSWRVKDVSRLLYSMKKVCTNEEMIKLTEYYDAFMPHLSSNNTGDQPESLSSRRGFSGENRKPAYKKRGIFCKSVLSEIHRIKYRLWRGRTQKCLKNNNTFRTTIHGNYTINMRYEWNVDTLIDLIDRHTLSLKGNLDNIIKASSKIGITWMPVSNANIKSVCIKEYRYLSLLRKFLYFFRNSPARKAWFAAHGLLALNFRTPKPIALCEEKRFGILRKSFVIMEDISAVCLPCNKYTSKKFSNPYCKIISKQKKGFISCLAQSFKHLHDSGVYHGDLKANNIMVMESHDMWDFFYLDLDRVCFNKRITLRKKIKNLSQLNASLPNSITFTDRLRFYKAYTSKKRLDDENKRIVRAIIQLSILRKHVWNPGTRLHRKNL